MIRAVVFDLDGVLVDAVEWHYLALNRALSLFGYPIPREEHAALYNGLPTSVKLELLSQRTGFPRSLHRFVSEKKQHHTEEILAGACGPDRRISALLEELKRQGLKLAVASNSVRATVDIILQRMGIVGLFDVILSNQDVLESKPSPEIYRKCQLELGVAAEEMLIIEDSVPGIKAATQACPNVFVVRGPHEVTLEAILGRLSALTTEPPRRVEIVIPMAGMGQRFLAAGYERPKPLIDILGKPMIQWVVENLTLSHHKARFTFLCNEQHLQEDGVRELLEQIAPGSNVISVPRVTQGAACTVCLALDKIDTAQPLVIANSDQWVDGGIDEFLNSARASNCDGMILTFPATDKKWSYAKLGPSGKVVEVAEKSPISPHATVGIYYFRRGADFFEAATDMMRAEVRTNGEFYVCPVYNGLVARNRKIDIFPIPAASMHGLGTPEDLEEFLRWNLTRAGRAAAQGIAPHYYV